MKTPSSDAGWTVVVVLVLLVAGPGIALLVTRQTPEPPPQRISPSAGALVTPEADGSQAPVEPAPGEEGEPEPALPSVTASICPSLAEEIPLRVLTLNTHGGSGPAGFGIDALARFILAADVDVALLQEVDRARPRSRFVDMPGELAARTGMEAAYGLNVRLGPNRGVSGLATLSRFPIVDQGNTYLPSRGGTKQRGVLRTDLDVDGTVVSVFNTHLEPGLPQVRLGQISAAMRSLAATDHPLILGGDLNATPGSSTLRVAMSGLRDAWVDAGTGPAETAPASNPRIRIDYLLYAPPLRVTRTEVLPGLVSDHRGVRSRFVLSVAGEEVCLPQLDGPIESGG